MSSTQSAVFHPRPATAATERHPCHPRNPRLIPSQIPKICANLRKSADEKDSHGPPCNAERQHCGHGVTKAFVEFDQRPRSATAATERHIRAIRVIRGLILFFSAFHARNASTPATSSRSDAGRAHTDARRSAASCDSSPVSGLKVIHKLLARNRKIFHDYEKFVWTLLRVSR